jgi:hypothetical protein
MNCRCNHHLDTCPACETSELKQLTKERDELKDMLETVAAQGAFAVRCAEKAEADSKRLRASLENLVCEAGDLSSHEIDGGAPDNRWEDMRVAITSAEQLLTDIDTEGKEY